MFFTDEIIKDIENSFQKRKEMLGDSMNEIDLRINKIENEEYKYSMRFLYAGLPISDLFEEHMFETLLSSVENTFLARDQFSWGKDIPIDMFLADVLFTRVSTEKIEDIRKYFFHKLYDRIHNKSMYDAVIEVNYFCYENATYQSTDMRTAPPSTLIKSGYGGCGEEAIFLVTALRSVGIPARQIYTPRWAHCDNNHAWVECYCDSQWYYLGACEPEEILDRGWFTSASSRAMLIESRAFYHNAKLSPDVETVKNGLVYNLNHTHRYADTVDTEITLLDEDKKPIENAKIILEIMNHGEFSPLNIYHTDQYGKITVNTGKGSLNIHIVINHQSMEVLIDTSRENNVEIIFKPSIIDNSEKVLVNDYDTHAPVDPGNKVVSLDQETIKRHKQNMANALKIRMDKEKNTMADVSSLVNKDLIPIEELKSILTDAKGNGENIIKFLNDVNCEYAVELLRTLNEKDYSDVNIDVIKAHLNNSLPYKDDYSAKIFNNYILAPRIFFEELTDYREYIANYFSQEDKGKFRSNPETVWDYISENIGFVAEEEFQNININPKPLLKIKLGSVLARKILFVAICRSLGIPARILADTVDIEYYKDGKFTSPIEGEIRDSSLKINFEEDVNWSYGTNWSIGEYEKGIYKTLRLKNTEIIDNKMILKSGNYRIITSNRLPNGDTYARNYVFNLEKDKLKEVFIELRKIEYSKMLNHVEIGDFYLNQASQTEKILVSTALSQEKNILFWIEENHEPSQHILNELLENKKEFADAKANLLFILRNEEASKNSLIAKVMEELNIPFLIDNEFEIQESIGRRTYVDPEKLPLIVVTESKLHSIFAISGYNVGTANLILNIMK